MTEIKIFPDKQALINSAQTFIIDKIQQAIAKNDICTIALAGGSTPKPIYEAIAKANITWEKLHVFWGDERYVPSSHPDSNEKMAREAWLNQVPIPANNIHAMPTSANNPELDAQKYNQELLDFFKIESGFPSFEIILLGMGDDGHTASLFPHTHALQVGDRLITVGNKDGNPRLTFTVPLINQAQCVIFLVSGESKQIALQQVMSENGDSNQYPSRLIKPQGELIWFLDKSATTNTSTNQ